MGSDEKACSPTLAPLGLPESLSALWLHCGYPPQYIASHTAFGRLPLPLAVALEVFSNIRPFCSD